MFFARFFQKTLKTTTVLPYTIVNDKENEYAIKEFMNNRNLEKHSICSSDIYGGISGLSFTLDRCCSKCLFISCGYLGD